MKKYQKICLIGATFSTRNMGVSALTDGIIQCILHHNPEAEIYLLDYGKEKIAHQVHVQNRNVSIKQLNMRFSKRIYLKNHVISLIIKSIFINLIPFQRVKSRIISNSEYLKHIYDSDFAASIAAGDSFSDIYGLIRLLYISLPQLFVLINGKKLILLPQTLGPFNKKATKFLAKVILNRAATVYSRDKYGLEEMQKLLRNNYDSKKFKQCYDVGFIIEPKKPGDLNVTGLLDNNRKDSFIIGLNVSGLLYRGGYSGDNMFGLKVNYRELILEIIHLLIQSKNANVLLVPHVFGISENSENDQVICSKLYAELSEKYTNKIFLAQGDYNQNEIKYIIGLCDFFIGSRMHACIAAISQNIPAISIAYSKKFKGVMQTMGVESLVADPREMEKEEILKIIIKGIENKDLLRRQLKRRAPEVKETVLNIFNNLNI